jgi:hypothetical protein
MLYPIKVAKKDRDDEKIHHEIDGQPDKVYLKIRAGLTWPNKSAPAYYCILGQRDQLNEMKRYQLIFFCEGQSNELPLLFDKLTDHARMLMCEEIYADFAEDRKCFRDLFSKYCRENQIRGFYLRQAPWPENFSFGLGIIQDWLAKKSLEIDKGTILANQLGKVSEDLLEDTAKAEIDFYAVNALRYVLGAFEKHPYREPMKDIDYGRPEKYPGFYAGISI